MGPFPMEGCWSLLRAEPTAATGAQQSSLSTITSSSTAHRRTPRGRGPNRCGRSSSPGPPEDTHPRTTPSPPAPLAAFFKQLLLHGGCSRGCLPQAKTTRDLEPGSIPAPAAGLALPPRRGSGRRDLWSCLEPLGSHKSPPWPQLPLS